MPNATRNRSDSPTKTCTKLDCTRPLRARGFCVTHYNDMRGKDWAYPKVETPCDWCGELTLKSKTKRHAKRFCTWACRDEWQRWNVRALACLVPDGHPSRSTAVPTGHPSRTPQPKPVPQFFAGYCAECGKGYVIASACVSASVYCSTTCSRRTAKRARRAREHGATGTFTWDGFMRLALSLGNVCAYCGGDNAGQPLEPDHVMPLSRGGHNGLANILPACRRCNGQKHDLLPKQWLEVCRQRGYDVSLCRFKHLTAHIFLATPHAA